MQRSPLLRRSLVAGFCGLLVVGSAYAGVGLAPTQPATQPTSAAAAIPSAPVDVTEATTVDPALAAGLEIDAATVADIEVGEPGIAVGAAKVSLYPQPEAYGGVWERDFDKCATLSASFLTESFDDPDHASHLATATANPWPENPDCLYMGGFGIGPMNPIVDWDSAPGDPGYDAQAISERRPGHGLWARATAITDGDDTIVNVLLDAEGYFWNYATKCDDCGASVLAERLGARHGFDPAGLMISSTHAHSSPDLIGGWGFVPDWYMAQVTDTIEVVVAEAIASATPATIEVGEERARQFNSERRDTYRSAEEQQVAWLRATEATGPNVGSTIATIGAYAAHPTSFGTNDGIAHADWPGLFEARLEERFGGIGMHLMTGLGNMSARNGRQMGPLLADLIPEVNGGTILGAHDVDVRVTRTIWQQPVTNAPLTGLGAPGFFDRVFSVTPATVQTGKSPDTAPCVSASAASVQLSATAVRIGSMFAMSAAPGEIFSNFSNTVKEKSGALVTMPLGQTNDALGYMPQQFEINEVGQQGLGFGIGGVLFVNYEDSYSVDRCVGDMALETQLAMLGAL